MLAKFPAALSDGGARFFDSAGSGEVVDRRKLLPGKQVRGRMQPQMDRSASDATQMRDPQVPRMTRKFPKMGGFSGSEGLGLP